jgi:subtilisin family serine protease
MPEEPQYDDFPIDQLIVWRKKEHTESDFKAWIEKLEKQFESEIILDTRYEKCDNRLILLSGPSIKTYIQVNAVDGRVSGGGGSQTIGEDGPVYYSLNHRLRHKKPKKLPISSSVISPSVISSGNPVKVAVLDTGIDPKISSKYPYKSSNVCCIEGAESGWNFVNNSPDCNDDNTYKHGSVVAQLIADQVNKSGKNGLEILPVKTHDANGVGELFDVLVAIAYATKMGAQIINASFGFYAPRPKISPEDDPADPWALLLRKYVDFYLTNEVLLVTAAGNSDIENLIVKFKEHGWPYHPTDARDLDQIGFLPASLARSRNFPNVIAVTTVHVDEKGEGTVSPNQNFSESVVDIGVIADAIVESEYVFNNPLFNKGETVEGSSFAAPIVTGHLCANYDKIKDAIHGKNFRKDDLWENLGTEIVRANPSLAKSIKGGKVMTRLK